MPLRFLFSLWIACLLTVSAAADDRPNILYIFADDQAFDTIAAHGNQEIQTPHLDSLVREGLTFSHTYNQGSWSPAVCVASRAMLNSGRFVWKAQKVHGKMEQERQAGRFWSEHMKKAGYDTYFTGKWHVQANARKAFDFVQHVRGGMPNQTPEGYHRPAADGSDPWSPSDPKFGGFWAGGKHWSEVVGDDAVEFLGQAAKREKPFFMYIAFNAPHDPRQSPQEYVDRYPANKIDVPESYLPLYPEREEMGSGEKLRDEYLAPFPRTEHSVQVHRQEYYAIINHMDDQIGRILNALEESGKADNTYIFFTADHGLAVGHHGLMGKQNMYDHSVRVPFLVKGPGIEGGTQNKTPIYLQDVMPTTLELAQIEKPDHVDFHSLLPLLRGEEATPYDAIYSCYLDRQRMITTDGYKLIYYPKAKKLKLFNLEDDPQEIKNLADDPAQKERIAKLLEKLRDWQEKTGDSLDLGGL